MRMRERSGSSNTAMKPIATPRMPARRSKTPPPSAADTASAARLRLSSMGAQCNARAAPQRRCYTTETIETGGLLRGDENVARAAHRLDHARPRRVVLHLAPQPGDADVDRAIEGLPVAVARDAEQLVAGEHLVGMLGERLEQI